MHTAKTYVDFISESTKVGSDSSFQEFAKTRLVGATKIAESAKEKGGLSMLTYHHFIVKLPYYKKAATGKFEEKAATAELRKLNTELTSILKTFEPKDQLPFQKVMGKIEVIGELLIKHSN